MFIDTLSGKGSFTIPTAHLQTTGRSRQVGWHDACYVQLMDTNRTRSQPLALEPMEESTPAGAAVQPDLPISTADKCLAEVTKQYQEGHIDPALRAQASVQSDNDKSVVLAADLQARATALQLPKRNERSERRTGRIGSSNRVESEPLREIVSAEAVGVRPRGPKLKYLAAAAVALTSVVGVVWLITSLQAGEAVRQPIVSAAVPSPNQSASEQPGITIASGGTNQSDLEPTLEATVQKLKEAGNWNVLVLYASAWTRREPNNAAAWNELSGGYAELRQLDDALDAATKAVQLSPEDSRLWRNLGHVDLALERLPEAGIAFDRALAVNPDDADALCGAALVAQRLKRPKDADAITRRVKSVDGSCPGMSDAESARVPARGSSTPKPALSAAR